MVGDETLLMTLIMGILDYISQNKQLENLKLNQIAQRSVNRCRGSVGSSPRSHVRCVVPLASRPSRTPVGRWT